MTNNIVEFAYTLNEALKKEQRIRLKKLAKRIQTLCGLLDREFGGNSISNNRLLNKNYKNILREARALDLGELCSLTARSVTISDAGSNLMLMLNEIREKLGYEKDEIESLRKENEALKKESDIKNVGRKKTKPATTHLSDSKLIESFPQFAQPYFVEAEDCYNQGLNLAAAAMIGNCFEALVIEYFKKKGWDLMKEVGEKKEFLSSKERCDKILDEIKEESYKKQFKQLMDISSFFRVKSNHPSSEEFNENRIMALLQHCIEIKNWMNKN